MVNMITALCGYFSGTFVCDTGGTFKSDTPGTFVSDIGGTFEVILSGRCYIFTPGGAGHAKKTMYRICKCKECQVSEQTPLNSKVL